MYKGEVRGKRESYCFRCAGYTSGKGFERREDWIKESLPPWLLDAEVYAAADWLEEQGRTKDAAHMRGLASGGFR